MENMKTNGILFSISTSTNAELVKDKKVIEMVEITVPLYHLTNRLIMREMNSLEKIQSFHKDIERIRDFSFVNCQISEKYFRFNCYFKQPSDMDEEETTLEKIAQVYRSYQAKLTAVFHSWDIFDFQERLHVNVYSK